MNKIEVSILHEAHGCPAGFMMFLAKLTQRGHKISDTDDLQKLYDDSMFVHSNATRVASLPHGTIKRFTPITISVVGASRRFLAQARTHSVGLNFMSASLQYSDYSEAPCFVAPYDVIKKGPGAVLEYRDKVYEGFLNYQYFAEKYGHDTGGYVMPHAMRNVLIIQGNHDAWANFINKRACRRNTDETRYVTNLIFKALLQSNDGEEMFSFAGPDCCYGQCREGRMSCNNPVHAFPDREIKKSWPLLEV